MNHQRRSLKDDRERSKKFYKVPKPLENWWKTILFVCLAAFAIDPLFLFIPVIDSHRFCFTFDKKVGAAACVIRTFIDTFYVIHIIFHWTTDLIAFRSQESRFDLIGEIPMHYKATWKRRLFFEFTVDILSVLPIPQVVVLTLFLRKQQSASMVSKQIVKWVIVCQYIPRIIRIYPVYRDVTRSSGTVVETKWIGAALNIFLYMLPSYVFGAFWYSNAIEREDRCWREACAKTSGCILPNLYCARDGADNSPYLNTSCPLIDPGQITNSTVFNFGMYIDAFKSRVVESRDFPRKFFYCFWWGLRNLSALGQNLETSNSVEEMVFAIIICVCGLLLFAVLIGNVQKYLQSSMIRVNEMEEKKRDTDKWMNYRRLPKYLQERIRRYNAYKWRETRGTEEETLLRSLPKGLRLETKRELYKDLLKSVYLFEIMDDGWLLEAVCDRVKSVFYSANSYIVKEGDPVEQMLIVTEGKLIGTKRYPGIGCANISFCLEEGDFYGDLLFWGLASNPSPRLPTSRESIMTVTDVEGFILLPDDFKFIASHYNRFDHVTLSHALRFSSPKWKSWAARRIQAAWKEHLGRKLSKISPARRSNLGKALDVSSELQSQGEDLAESGSISTSVASCSHPPLVLKDE